MRTIDIHAHLMPQCFWNAVKGGGSWYRMTHEPGGPNGVTVSNGRRDPVTSPKLLFNADQRVKDMDEQGVDVQVVSVATPMFGYHLSPDQGLQLAQEVNQEIASMTRQWPQRFAGMATLPLQDVGRSIKELERTIGTLGFKGAELDTVVNGKSWDEPEFLPLFKAAEEMGAVLFFHPQPNNNLVSEHFPKFAMGNSFGVPLEVTLVVVAALIFGGILDQCPDLKVCIAHGGGPGLLWHGTNGPGLAGQVGGSGQHRQPAQQLSATALLRLHHHARKSPAFPDRQRRVRPGGAGQRLALCWLGPVAGGLDQQPGEPDPSGKRGYSGEEIWSSCWEFSLPVTQTTQAKGEIMGVYRLFSPNFRRIRIWS